MPQKRGRGESVMPTHMYYYEHQYHDEQAAQNGPSKRMQTLYTHRKLLPRDKKYYMNCLVMNIQDPEIGIFKLGIGHEPPFYTVKNRCDNAVFLNFVTDGAGYMNDKRFESGDMYFTLPMQKHDLISDNAEPWSTVWMMISGSYVDEIQDWLSLYTTDLWLKYVNPDTIIKIAEFFIYSSQPSKNPVQYVKGIVQTLLSFVCYDAKDSANDKKITFAMQKIIFKAKDEIYKNLSTCTVSSIANKVHLERKYFCKLFTAVTDMTPQDYILECKMNWVKNALIETDLSVNELVAQIGYTHRNGLLAAFKKQFGCSPSEYRKLNKK